MYTYCRPLQGYRTDVFEWRKDIKTQSSPLRVQSSTFVSSIQMDLPFPKHLIRNTFVRVSPVFVFLHGSRVYRSQWHTLEISIPCSILEETGWSHNVSGHEVCECREALETARLLALQATALSAEAVGVVLLGSSPATMLWSSDARAAGGAGGRTRGAAVRRTVCPWGRSLFVGSEKC